MRTINSNGIRRLLLSFSIAVMAAGCASQASHFNTDIVESITVCKGQPFKTKVGLVQCYGAVERPVVLKDLPNFLYAYDLWHSTRLSAANDYDNQVRLVREKADAAAKPKLDTSMKRLGQELAGIISLQTQTDKDLLKQETDNLVDFQCKKDGAWKSASAFVNLKCDRDARLPAIERRLPAAKNAVLNFYNERLVIASDYDKAVWSATQAAIIKFNETVAPAQSRFRSQVRIALQSDAVSTARQRQEITDLLAMLAIAALAIAGGAADQPSHPVITTSCTSSNGVTNCLSF